MRISDWSSDVCSSDLVAADGAPGEVEDAFLERGQIGIARVPVVGETGHKQEGEERCIVPRIQRTLGDSSKRLFSLRSDERRVGRECVCMGRFRWCRYK